MDDRKAIATDLFSKWRELTSARIGLERCGKGLSTRDVLDLQLAHAQARDAVRSSLDIDDLSRNLHGQNICVRSRAGSRADYLRNPGAGRVLADDSCLPSGTYDVVIVLADGLSARAIQQHGWKVANALKENLRHWTCAPFVTAIQARVAIGDQIGSHFAAKLVVTLIGERPGLSAFDSVGAYLTWDPKPGRMDSERNCVSNIRPQGGLEPDIGAANIAWLAEAARKCGLTGVGLKDRFEVEGSLLKRLPDPATAICGK